MTTMMKAAVVRAFGQPLTIEDVPVPEVTPGSILVKVEASGVCHSDLHAAAGDWPVKPTLPFIPGHEGTGFVAAVGGGVKGVKEGDRVGVPWLYTACGRCEHCLTGWETFCPEQKNTGYSVNGGFAEYVLADPHYVAHIPATLDLGAAAPVICAGLTVYKALKETGTRPGQWIAIAGIGGLGHMAVQYAKILGLRVAAIDVTDDKLALARTLGADVTVNAGAEDPAAAVREATGGVHGVLVTAVSRKAFVQSAGMVRRRGTIVLVGLPPGQLPVSIIDIVQNGITIRGSVVGTRQDLNEALALAADGRVTPTFSWDRLDSINEIFDRMKAGAITGRVVMKIAN